MRRFLAGLAHALLLSAACGGGGGGGGGAPPETLAQGTIIDDSSSINVDGTVFDTDAADVEGDVASAAELAPGMQVTVEGSRSGDTGTATRVTFDLDLEGEVEAFTAIDAETSEIVILGQTVVLQEPVTRFEGVAFDDIDAGSVGNDVLQVSGLRDGDGAILATWIRLVAVPGAFVTLEGEVEGLVGGSFTIGPIEVLYDETGVNTALPGVPEGGLADGDFVDVLGTWLGGDTVDADLAPAPGQGIVELEQRAIEETLGDVQLEGIVSDFARLADFLVSGQPVNAGRFGVEFEVDVLGPDLGDGDRVEVEGRTQGGVLVAQAVRLRAGEVRIDAAVEAVDVEAGSVDLLDGAIVEVDSATRYDGFDDLADLVIDDFLEVRGVDLGDVVLPTEIRRVASSAVARVVGRVEAFDGTAGRFTIVGVRIATDGSTSYTGFPAVANQNQFYAFLSACPAPLLEVGESSTSDTDAPPLEAATIELEQGCTP